MPPLLPVRHADAEALVVIYLKSRIANVRVVNRVPADRPARFLSVRRSGGLADHVVDRPRLDVYAWGTDDDDARDLAAAARAEIGGIRGNRDGWQVTGVEEFAGLSPAPDQSGQARWFFSIEITVRGVPL
ncbi:hypothetical protein AB0I61_17350 [Polymorphospora rubra]|uniref:hypothetical protein n=1 Tax=Polymorphospora rubra TaxID=338584 RepID=UPI0033E62E77